MLKYQKVPVIQVFHPGFLTVSVFEQFPALIETGFRCAVDVGILLFKLVVEFLQPLFHTFVDVVEFLPS